MHSLNSLYKQGNLTLDQLALHVNPSEVCYKKEEKDVAVIIYLEFLRGFCKLWLVIIYF